MSASSPAESGPETGPKTGSSSPFFQHALAVFQVIVTVGLLWWLFHDPERRQAMTTALAAADWRWMVLAVISAGVCEFFGILRWKLFLRMLHVEVPFKDVTKLFFIGAFFNQFLPGTTGGDVVRVIYLMRDRPDDKTAGFLSVAVDRLLAVLVLVVMGLAFAWGRSSWFAQSFSVGNLMKWFAITLFVMLAVLVMSFIVTNRQMISRLPQKFPFRAHIIKLSTLWQLCIENRKEAIWGTIYTVPMLFAYFTAFTFAARAFIPADQMSFERLFIDMSSVMPLVTAVSSLPISLNGIGVREALFGEILADLFKQPAGVGVLISIAGMFVYLLWGLVGAVYYLERIKRNYCRSNTTSPK